MYIQYDNINNYTLKEYQIFYNSLTKNDKLRIDKIVNKNKQKQFILSRIILKNILKDKYNINYQDVIIKYNKYDKPTIDNIYFNISHSHDYVIVATSNKEIGIDIEKIRKVNLNIAKRFCTDNEYAYILNSNNKYYHFWQIYTLKEAYFKMIGQDLANIKNIEFSINDKITIKNHPNINIISSNEINDYIIAIIYK